MRSYVIEKVKLKALKIHLENNEIDLLVISLNEFLNNIWKFENVWGKIGLNNMWCVYFKNKSSKYRLKTSQQFRKSKTDGSFSVDHKFDSTNEVNPSRTLERRKGKLCTLGCPKKFNILWPGENDGWCYYKMILLLLFWFQQPYAPAKHKTKNKKYVVRMRRFFLWSAVNKESWLRNFAKISWNIVKFRLKKKIC